MKVKIKRHINFRLILEITIFKLLYLFSAELMLPEKWEIWSFNKNVNWNYIGIELIFFYFILAIYLQTQRKKSVYSFYSTLFLLVYFIPNNSVLVLSGYDFGYYFWIMLFCALMFAVLAYLAQKEFVHDVAINQNGYISKIWENKKVVNFVRFFTVVVCGITIVRAYLYNGLDLNFIWNQMYDVRAEYAAYATNLEGTMMSYIVVLLSRLCSWMMLICLYFSLLARKKIDVVLCVFAQLALFSMEMQKSTLMIMLVVFFLAYVEKRGKMEYVNGYIIKGMIVFWGATLLEYYIRGESYIYHLVVRRLFYMPSYLTNVYYEFFAENPKVWFSQDVLFVRNIVQAIFGSPYNSNIVKTISDYCFDGLIPSPNNGLFSEAHAQMGALGIIVFPFIYGVYVKIMRDAAVRFGYGAALVIMTKLFLTMMSTPALQSGNLVGVIIFIFISFYMHIRMKEKGIKMK